MKYPLLSDLLAACKIAVLLYALEANRTDIGPPTSCYLLDESLIMPNPTSASKASCAVSAGEVGMTGESA